MILFSKNRCGDRNEINRMYLVGRKTNTGANKICCNREEIQALNVVDEASFCYLNIQGM